MLPIRTSLAIAAGAVGGATLRHLANEAIGWNGSGWPWATFIVNVAGCLAIALAVVRVDPSSQRWAFIGPGALGGLTTMSTFLVEAHVLWVAEEQLLAVAYVVGTLAVTLITVELIRARAT